MFVNGISGEICDVREVVIKSGAYAGTTKLYAKFLSEDDGRLLPVELADGVSLDRGIRKHSLDITWGDAYKDGKYQKYYRAVLLN